MRLLFYRVNPVYCDFLRQYDNRVPYTSAEKQLRPFVGIILEEGNGIKCFAPLTSPKPKHLTMKNQIDFLKINGGVWGAINFNNMIPIHEQNLMKVDLIIRSGDTRAEINYKNLLTNQLSWCNSNRENILNKARKLYSLITEGKAPEKLTERCCDFNLLEEKYSVYIEMQRARQEAAAAVDGKGKPAGISDHIEKAKAQLKDQARSKTKLTKNQER